VKAREDHRCEVFGSPWPGVFGTRIDSERHYGRHWHATYGFGALEHGAQRSASGRGTVEAYAGDLITTNPGEVHDGRPLGGPSRRWRMLYLEPQALASMTGGRTDVEFTRPVFRDGRLLQALQRLFEHLDDWRCGRCDALAADEALVRACALMLEGHATASPADEAGGDVRQARDRLADDLLHSPTLSELAAAAGLSRYQLLRRFEKAYGVPPHAWLMQRRADRARGLIRNGMGLAEAAASCGFADQSHLTRFFVRQFGFTPGAWQRAACNNVQDRGRRAGQTPGP
jgi:AraC-like DNA-binding protein